MQAALITAYKDQSQLRRLVRFLSAGMKVFVHVDAKSAINPSDVRAWGATAISRYRIGWGSYRHLLAVIDLMRMALSDESVGYLHVISGQDMPVQPLEWFRRTFDGCDRIYARPVDVASAGYDRTWHEHYHLSTFLDLDKKARWMNRLHDAARQIQDRLHVRRRGLGPYPVPCKSLVYVSLPRDAARHAVEAFDRSARLRLALRFCLIPEELFFMTVLRNSPFADRIAGADLRYCDWRTRHGACRAYLDESDYGTIRAGADGRDYAFARKVDSMVSAGLIARLARDIGMEADVE